MNYKLVGDFISGSGLLDDYFGSRGKPHLLTYQEPTDLSEPRICVLPNGGAIPGEVLNFMDVQVYLISSANPQDVAKIDQDISAFIDYCRCNYTQDGYSIQLTNAYPRPSFTDSGRIVFQFLFRIL